MKNVKTKTKYQLLKLKRTKLNRLDNFIKNMMLNNWENINCNICRKSLRIRQRSSRNHKFLSIIPLKKLKDSHSYYYNKSYP